MKTQMQTTEARKTMNGKPVYTVEAKSVINFDSGFLPKLLCDGPTFTAGTCCAYSCTFCSVPATMWAQLQPKGWLTTQGVEGKHADIVVRRGNAVELARKQLMSRNLADRQKKKVIYASALVDIAANTELRIETEEICKVILELTNWDIRLLSKSNVLHLIAESLGNWRGDSINRVIYGFSTGTLNDKLAAAFEQDCPWVSKRLKSLYALQDAGHRTFGMVCPSLPQWEEGLNVHQAYDKFAREMGEAIRWEKCEHVWAEVINLRGDNFTKTVEAMRRANFEEMAVQLERITGDRREWENYARLTYLGHRHFYETHGALGKLRFLQYVTSSSKEWWTQPGVVVLGD